MRSLAVTAWCFYVALTPTVLADQAGEKVDQNWAKQLAMDFLEAATSSHPSAAIGLLTPQLSKSLEADKKLLDRWSGGCYSSPEITSEERSPVGNEIRYSGVLKGDRDRGWGDADFTLRLTRDSHDRCWFIRYFQLKPHELGKN